MRRTKQKRMHRAFDLFSTTNINVGEINSRNVGWAGHRNAQWIFAKKTGRKEPFGRPRRKREDAFKMDLRGAGQEDMEWFLRGSGGPLAGNEISGPISFWELLHKLRNYWLLKNSAPWRYLRNFYPRPATKKDHFFSDVREPMDGGERY